MTPNIFMQKTPPMGALQYSRYNTGNVESSPNYIRHHMQKRASQFDQNNLEIHRSRILRSLDFGGIIEDHSFGNYVQEDNLSQSSSQSIENEIFQDDDCFSNAIQSRSELHDEGNLFNHILCSFQSSILHLNY